MSTSSLETGYHHGDLKRALLEAALEMLDEEGTEGIGLRELARKVVDAVVATGWDRAKRTILIADGVNFLAAIVLYVLASSSVRGFAFTLGLTTLLDILIVFMFTHPCDPHIYS